MSTTQIGSIAGTGATTYNGDYIKATTATIYGPTAAWGDTNGHIYIAECGQFRVRKVDADSKIISTVVGSGISSMLGTYYDDIKATSADVSTIYACCDTGGTLYVVDTLSGSDGGLIRTVSNTGYIHSIVGNRLTTPVGDNGPATSAGLDNPVMIWLDSLGNMYISLFAGGRIKKVDTINIVSTIAGTGVMSNEGASVLNTIGDDGKATSATLNGCIQLYGDTAGLLYFADAGNNKIRTVDLIGGMMYKVAGSGTKLSGVNGPADNTDLNGPFGLWGDTNDVLYFSEFYGSRIISVANGDLLTVAGSGLESFEGASAGNLIGDGGGPLSATFMNPYGLFVSARGDLFIADQNNNRIRVVYDIAPTIQPSILPSFVPTAAPSFVPSIVPSLVPSVMPSMSPSTSPTMTPSGQPQVADIVSNLIAYFPFNTNTVDASGTGKTVVATGASLTSDRNGNTGHAVQFAAPSQYLQVTSTPKIELGTSDFTISAWVKRSGLGGSRILSHGVADCNDPGYYIGFNVNDQVSCGLACSGGCISVLSSSTMTTTGVWFHIAARVERGVSMKLYVNGLLNVVNIPVPFTCDVTGQHNGNLIGAFNAAGVDQFIGSLDDIRVYLRALTEEEIQTLYDVEKPSMAPTSHPSSISPTSQPSVQPSQLPSDQPSAVPSSSPSRQPSSQPSLQPFGNPTSQPSTQPVDYPTSQPSMQPTQYPSQQPLTVPTTHPSSQPSRQPTSQPSSQPNGHPSLQPSKQPSLQPAGRPTLQPSVQPSSGPTSQPSNCPSRTPSSDPSDQPFASPSSQPSGMPSAIPSGYPTSQPISIPSCQPSSEPSVQSVVMPSSQPSIQPSVEPTTVPRVQPSSTPTVQPTHLPSGQPFAVPSSQPSDTPSHLPTTSPSLQPISRPSHQPSAVPSAQLVVIPSSQPSLQPLTRPTRQPTSSPSTCPSVHPSLQPTSQPFVSPSTAPSFSGQTYSPTVEPTSMPTRRKPISVTYASNKSIDFKILLPFMFTNAVNGDGMYDVQIDSPTVGESLVVFGGEFNVGNMHTSLSPVVSLDYTGRSVSNAGDVNGDGYDDLIIGVPFSSRCHVFLGKKEGFVNMTEGFTFFGVQSFDLTGWSVSGAGDVNNDTFADFIIGAPSAGLQPYAGSVYVLFGRTNWSNIDLAHLSSSEGYVIYGEQTQDCLGLSVSNAGDVNGDGFDDVIMGAVRANEFFSGGAYILFGGQSISPTGVMTISQLLSLSQVVSIVGPPWSWFGYSVSGTSDVNGDGVDDVLIGSLPRRVSLGTPVSYLVYGKRTGSFVSTVVGLPASEGVEIEDGGVIVTGVGDVNDDGFSDVLLVGSSGALLGAGLVIARRESYPLLTSSPSLIPSALPSVKPSLLPSQSPTMIPTRPTVVPSIAPTGPSFNPTMMPTQPTSVPSAQPSTPSITPSMIPSVLPTVISSADPSVAPTALPSTYSPTTCMPSTRPTIVSTRKPTGYPL